MNAKPSNLVGTVLVGGAIVASLYFGREVLLPIALAVLLSFVLAPPVRLLQRLYLPRLVAIAIVVLLAFGVIFGLATFMFAQVSELAAELPTQTDLICRLDLTHEFCLLQTPTLKVRSYPSTPNLSHT
jgi:predicted PurR-regulated permease PerM